MNPFSGQLRVWWIPESSDGKISSINVSNIREAKITLFSLSESGILKSGLQVWNGYEWDEWYDNDDNDINSSELA
jgi:hypothetical protein